MDIPSLARAYARTATVTAINYHNTPAFRADEYDRELAAIAERFSPATEDDLAHYLATGTWRTSKPGIVLAFYNGYRNNYDIMRPLLEKHGLIGWFFAVTAYSSCPPADQIEFGSVRRLKTIPDEYADGRYALSWDELRSLDRDHVVASHTRNHTRVSLDDAAAIEDEIVGAQNDFRAELGHPVRAFAWLFGGAYGENPVADAGVDRAGYEFLFSNFRIQRLPRAFR